MGRVQEYRIVVDLTQMPSRGDRGKKREREMAEERTDLATQRWWSFRGRRKPGLWFAEIFA